MDASVLAQKMLAWEKAKIELEALEAEIREAVIEIGSTQKVGNVAAKYRSGARSFDYETPARAAPLDVIEEYTTVCANVDWDAVADEVPVEIIEKHTVVSTSVDWKSVCKAANIEPVVTGQRPDTVSVELLKVRAAA